MHALTHDQYGLTSREGKSHHKQLWHSGYVAWSDGKVTTRRVLDFTSNPLKSNACSNRHKTVLDGRSHKLSKLRDSHVRTPLE